MIINREIVQDFCQLKKLRMITLFLIGSIFVTTSSVLAQSDRFNSEFTYLEQELTKSGFTVKRALPPYQNRYGIRPYGSVSNKESIVWLNPVVFELGNALPTLVHETVHAAQLCKGDRTTFKLLDLKLDPPKITHPYFLRYHNYRRAIEAEAYTVQVQPNSVELAVGLLAQNCLNQKKRNKL